MTLNKDTRMMPLKSFKKPRSKLVTYYKTIYWNLMNLNNKDTKGNEDTKVIPVPSKLD